VIDEDHHIELELQKVRRDLAILKTEVLAYVGEFYEDDRDGSRIQWPSELAKLTGWEAPDE
jgi:hypothetical protein